MALDGGVRGPGPDEDGGVVAVSAFCGERSRDVDERVCQCAEVTQARGPFRRAGLRFRERCGQGTDGLVEIGPGDGLAAAVVGELARCFRGEKQRVFDSAQRLAAVERPLHHLPARVAEHDEVTGEVSAVDRRYVPRLERPEVARLVPVVEVAPEALEAAHAGQCRFEPLDGFERPEPAEVPRGGRREQIEPDVGGRGTMGHDRLGVFLEIVGRQVVVGGAHECFEEAPRAARHRTENPGLARRKTFDRVGRCRAAQPSGSERREQPQQDERRGERPALRCHESHEHAHRDGERDGPMHPAIRSAELPAKAGLGPGGSDPFEHRPVRHPEADERPHDRVAHQPRLVREEREMTGEL